MRVTANVFRFESSILDQRDVPGNILDWFEVAYQRKYAADGDVLLFTNGGVTGEVEYEVTGFSTVPDRGSTTSPIPARLWPSTWASTRSSPTGAASR